MTKQNITRRSLTQHFSPMPGFIGEFGWVCGYSADAHCMDIATERFTGQTASVRASLGCIRLGLLLDRGNRQVRMGAVPGLAHFAMRDGAVPFRLMHAKVALLGYRHEDDDNRFQVRLLVSTGNWTRATLEDSIDLVWRIDIDSQDLASDAGRLAQGCTDIAAAWDMLAWLGGHYDTALLEATPSQLDDTESSLARDRLAAWLAEVGKHAQGTARFIDNRTQSLLANLGRKLKAQGNDVARNYLAMGAGFYEAPGAGLPVVPRKIVDMLQEKGLLTAKPTVDLFVNPKACQCIATGLDAISHAGPNPWTVRPAARVDKPGMRSLHAKFLFSARHTGTSNRCSSAWSYLGSGNLTPAGFLNRASHKGGNLEAGVVQAHDDLFWYASDEVAADKVATNLLPMQWDDELTAATQLGAGNGMTPRVAEYLAPPVSHVSWLPHEHGGGWLCPNGSRDVALSFADAQGRALAPESDGRIRWPGNPPQDVMVRWSAAGQPRSAYVPVMDQHGRFAAGAAPRLGIEQAGWELDRFPGAPDDDRDDDPDGTAEWDPDDDPHRRVHPPLPPTKGAGTGSYPIRQMMTLVERIADKQCAIAPRDWPAWCHRLEQVLARVGGGRELQAFLALGINPLSALYGAPFRPGYAETASTEAGRRYEAVLARVEHAWGVTELEPIGGAT